MSQWQSQKASRVPAALLRIGWSIKREHGGAYKILSRAGWQDVVFAFHERDEIVPRVLEHTGLRPEGL